MSNRDSDDDIRHEDIDEIPWLGLLVGLVGMALLCIVVASAVIWIFWDALQ